MCSRRLPRAAAPHARGPAGSRASHCGPEGAPPALRPVPSVIPARLLDGNLRFLEKNMGDKLDGGLTVENNRGLVAEAGYCLLRTRAGMRASRDGGWAATLSITMHRGANRRDHFGPARPAEHTVGPAGRSDPPGTGAALRASVARPEAGGGRSGGGQTALTYESG